MRDTPESKPSAAVDAAYLAAEALMADPTNEASAQRRRATVLAAVQAQQLQSQPLQAVPTSTERKAANEAHWWRGDWRGGWSTSATWRGAVAASVLVCSTLLVWRVVEQPEAVVGTAESVAARADKNGAPRVQAAPAAAALVTSPSSAEVGDKDVATAAKVQSQRQVDNAPAAAARRAEKPAPAVRQTPAAPAAVAKAARPAPAQAAAPAPAPAQAVELAPARALAQSSTAPGAAPPEPVRESAAAPTMAPLVRSAAPVRDRKADATITASKQAAFPADMAAAPPKPAQVDEDKDRDGRTALAQAVLRGNAQVVAQLLKQGANPLAPDRFGQTPRDHARSLGNAAVLEAMGL
jgi:hypothetical protein